jgi:menaquinone-dependent protoporphyrinogen oxidase
VAIKIQILQNFQAAKNTSSWVSAIDNVEYEMDQNTLVAFASKYGATEEIAEKIGEVLRQEGLLTDVISADRVGSLAPYEAVVLGSAVYVGRWRKEAVKFLKTYEKELAKRPVWLFSSGPSGAGDPLELLNGWRFPAVQESIANRIHPRDMAVFHGNVDFDKLNFIEKGVIENVKAPTGDFRDWEAITSWATSIANELKNTDLPQERDNFDTDEQNGNS